MWQRQRQQVRIYNPNRSLNLSQSSPLELPASMPGFGLSGVGSRPATGLNGFGDDWFSSIGTAISTYLPQVVTTAANVVSSTAAAKLARAEAERQRAQAEQTSALATLQRMKNSPTTWGILAAIAAAGALGYILIKKRRRSRRQG